MDQHSHFVDLHCHLLPQLDDGARSWDESLEMARLAVADGIGTIVVTPHQLGSFAQNTAEKIRGQLQLLQQRLTAAQIPLQLLPGADVRIEPDLPQRIRHGQVLTLADHGRHVLLELPHELYVPLEGLLRRLQAIDCVGILSHPERNLGILADPSLVPQLVESGCLMQITASSLMGAFGSASQHLAESLLRHGCVHFVATDAHGVRSRRPLLCAAYERVAALTDRATADDLCCDFPHRVCLGQPVPAGRRLPRPRRTHWWRLGRAA